MNDIRKAVKQMTAAERMATAKRLLLAEGWEVDKVAAMTPEQILEALTIIIAVRKRKQ